MLIYVPYKFSKIIQNIHLICFMSLFLFGREISCWIAVIKNIKKLCGKLIIAMIKQEDNSKHKGS